jgi:hypothetical protein
MAGRFPGEMRGVRQEFADGASSLDDAFRKNVHRQAKSRSFWWNSCA